MKEKIKLKIIIALVILGFLPINVFSANSILGFGAIPDDGNDDSQAIIDAVASGEDIYFPDGVYNVSSSLILNISSFQDNSLYALNYKGATIKGNGNAKVKAHYFFRIKNFVFDNIGVEIFGGDERNKTRYFESNEFINLPQDVPCILLNGYYGPVGHIHIHHNRFIGGRHTVIGDIKNSTIEYNYSEGCKRNYEFHDYAENVIVRFNELHGGIVGIGFFCTHNGNDNVKFGNIIEYNKCYDQSEEGISFDNFGNRSDSYSRYTGLVTDYKSNKDKATRLYLNTTPVEDLTDRYAFFVDDNKIIKGFHSKIIEMGVEENKSYIDLRSGPDDDLLYENARIVVLTYPAKQNKIRYNTVERVGRTGIVFHGAGNFNLIENNVVVDCNHELPERHDFWGGISLRNMNSANIPGVHGPVFYNIVRNNTASGIRCDINAYNLNYGQEVFVAIGNEVYDNTYLNGALKDVRAADNEPGKDIPSIEISDPADYSSASCGEEFSINATLKHFDHADSVVLLQNAKKIDVLYSAPYEFEIQDIDSGSHVFQVVGIGSAGDIKVTDHITVLCKVEAPSIEIPTSNDEDSEVQKHTLGRINVFPNPIVKNGVVHLKIPGHLLGYAQINFFDTVGKSVLKASKEINTNAIIPIHLENKMPGGIYYLSFSIGDYKETKKLLVY